MQLLENPAMYTQSSCPPTDLNARVKRQAPAFPFWDT